LLLVSPQTPFVEALLGVADGFGVATTAGVADCGIANARIELARASVHDNVDNENVDSVGLTGVVFPGPPGRPSGTIA
jgi:hypothetical protein